MKTVNMDYGEYVELIEEEKKFRDMSMKSLDEMRNGSLIELRFDLWGRKEYTIYPGVREYLKNLTLRKVVKMWFVSRRS